MTNVHRNRMVTSQYFTKERPEMPIETIFNGEWVKEVSYYPLRLTLPELGRRAGIAQNYIYQLCDPENDRKPNIETIDRIANAIEERYVELHIPPPDNIWRMLTVQKRIEREIRVQHEPRSFVVNNN